jgi:hypothetical protein
MSPHWLLFIHLLLGAALSASLLGEAVAGIALLQRGSGLRWFRILASSSVLTYLAEAAIGLVNYPPYRIDVRAHYLDRAAPWATRLFDVKENLVLIAFPLVAGAWFLSRSFDPERDRRFRAILTVCAVGAAVLVGLGSVMGFVVCRIRML